MGKTKEDIKSTMTRHSSVVLGRAIAGIRSLLQRAMILGSGHLAAMHSAF